MKVFAINYRPSSFWNFSGCEKRLAAMISELKKFGVKFYLIESSPSIKNFFKLDYTSITITHLPNLFISILWWLISAFTKILKLKLFNENFDLIYVSTNNLPNILIGIIASKLFNKPLIVIFHHPRWPLPYCKEKVDLSIRYLYRFFREEGLGVLDSFIRALSAKLELILFKTNIISYTIFISPWIAKHICKLGYRGMVFISSNGYYLNNPILPVNKSIDAIYIGRLDEGKGLVKLLLVWKLVVKQLSSAILVIIGTGTLYKKLNNLIKRLNIVHNVLLLGFIKEDLKQKLLSKSKIFITLSRMEGWCLAIDEALAMGLTIICYNIPVFSYRLNNLKNGAVKLISTEKLSEIAKVVIETLQKTSLVKNSCLMPVNIIRKDWESVAKVEYRIFQKIISSFNSAK